MTAKDRVWHLACAESRPGVGGNEDTIIRIARTSTDGTLKRDEESWVEQLK